MITKTMKTLLFAGIIAAMILPFSSMGFAEPLRVQLEQGIDTNQLQCNNPNHVLVLRTNGNVACVTEKTSMTLGWEVIYSTSIHDSSIIDAKTSIDNYNKDYLKNLATIDSETDDSENASSAPSYYSPGWAKVEISKIPKLGEIFEITVTAQADPPTIKTHDVSFFVTEQFEFVADSLPENVSITEPTYRYDDRLYVTITTDEVKTANVTVQVKAIKEGHGIVYGGASNYKDQDGRTLIYVDRDNSFYYNDDDEPTEHFVPRHQYGIDFNDLVKLQEDKVEVYGISKSSVDGIITESDVTSDDIREFALQSNTWSEEHMSDNTFYWEMPQAENIKTTVVIPETITVGSTEIVTVTLESIDRTSDYEHVLIDVKLGAGIKLDAQEINLSTIPDYITAHGDKMFDAYNNDIFAIGANNTLTVNYPIKATQTGTWMLNFVVNGEFERHLIIVE